MDPQKAVLMSPSVLISPPPSPPNNRLFGLVVKASDSRAEDPVFESRWRRHFSGSIYTNDFKIGPPVATLPGAGEVGGRSGLRSLTELRAPRTACSVLGGHPSWSDGRAGHLDGVSWCEYCLGPLWDPVSSGRPVGLGSLCGGCCGLRPLVCL